MNMWWSKTVSDYDMLKIFVCPAYYHVNDGKLESRVKKAMF